jgi:hypothetical protein
VEPRSQNLTVYVVVGILSMGRTALAVEFVQLYIIVFKRLNQGYIDIKNK